MTTPRADVRAIALTGPMGSGKSAVGRALARALGWPFVDADEAIVERAGKPIAAIFADSGEAAFRQLERETIADLLEQRPLVLALGGGAFLDPETRARCLAPGCLSVYLATRPETSWRRIRAGNGPARPLLQVDDPLEQLRSILEQRRPLYEQAHLTVCTDERSVPELVRGILERAGIGHRR